MLFLKLLKIIYEICYNFTGDNMKYKTLLIDIDDTLLDFHKSEDIAIRKLFDKYIPEQAEKIVPEYKKINKQYWRMHEEGKIGREELIVKRFKDIFNSVGLYDYDFSKINEEYFSILANVPVEIDGAEEFLKVASMIFDIYAVTNGVKRVQERRLSLVSIPKYFKKIFISEEVGYQKPDIRFFDHVFKELNIKSKDEVVIFGDSLSSDIQGGINYGIDTIWYNPKGLESDVNYTYSVKSYEEFFELMERIK